MQRFVILLAYCIAFLLSYPAMLHSEIVRLACGVDSKSGPAELLFDTVNQKVKYSVWPWSNGSHWDEKIITWTSIQINGSLTGAFSFKRESQDLIILVLTREDWSLLKAEIPISRDISVTRCTRGF